MGFKDITEGKRTAVPIMARFIEPEGKTPSIEIIFEFEEPSTGKAERIPWNAYFSADATERSMKTLKDVLSFNGNFDVVAPDGIKVQGTLSDPDVIAFGREVEIDIQLEEYNGRTRAKVAWVNAIGGNKQVGCAPEQAAGIVERLGLREAFEQLKDMGAPTKEETKAPPPAKKELKNHAPPTADKKVVKGATIAAAVKTAKTEAKTAVAKSKLSF